jgi:quercetin dioxygenase-like cupin family protein
MDHIPAGSRQPQKAPSAWFTGEVTTTGLFETTDPARLRGTLVTFAPGARTHWHTHPLGQALHITAGRGRAQVSGGPVIRLATGDTVWFPPGELHWHGADPDAPMTHLALHEALDGVTVTWDVPVTDADYLG